MKKSAGPPKVAKFYLLIGEGITYWLPGHKPSPQERGNLKYAKDPQSEFVLVDLATSAALQTTQRSRVRHYFIAHEICRPFLQTGFCDKRAEACLHHHHSHEQLALTMSDFNRRAAKDPKYPQCMLATPGVLPPLEMFPAAPFTIQWQWWPDNWHSRAPGDPNGRNMITILRPHATCLTILLNHYDWIVYLGLSFWRRLIVMYSRADGRRVDKWCPEWAIGGGSKWTLKELCAWEHGLLGGLKQVTPHIPRCVCETRGAFTPAQFLATEPLNQFKEFLTWATRSGQTDVLANLVNGLHMNVDEQWGEVRTSSEQSLLTIAITAGLPKMVRTLLTLGADVGARDATGSSTLFLACAAGKLETCDVLLSHSSDKGDVRKLLEAENDVGETALFQAVATPSQLEIVSLLLAAGADVSASNYEGHTALHRAACEGDQDIVCRLLDAGADANATTLLLETPSDLAYDEGERQHGDAMRRRFEIAEMLLHKEE